MPSTFRRLDRLFWIIWALAPLLLLELFGMGPGAWVSGTDPTVALDQELLRVLPGWGVSLWWISQLSNFVIAVICLILAHMVIHRAANGRLFEAAIQRMVRGLAILVLIWAAFQLVVDNLIIYASTKVPDGPPFVPLLIPDLTLIGYGLFLLALSLGLAEAIRLRQDADLTI